MAVAWHRRRGAAAADPGGSPPSSCSTGPPSSCSPWCASFKAASHPWSSQQQQQQQQRSSSTRSTASTWRSCRVHGGARRVHGGEQGRTAAPTAGTVVTRHSQRLHRLPSVKTVKEVPFPVELLPVELHGSESKLISSEEDTGSNPSVITHNQKTEPIIQL